MPTLTMTNYLKYAGLQMAVLGGARCSPGDKAYRTPRSVSQYDFIGRGTLTADPLPRLAANTHWRQAA